MGLNEKCCGTCEYFCNKRKITKGVFGGSYLEDEGSCGFCTLEGNATSKRDGHTYACPKYKRWSAIELALYEEKQKEEAKKLKKEQERERYQREREQEAERQKRNAEEYRLRHQNDVSATSSGPRIVYVEKPVALTKEEKLQIKINKIKSQGRIKLILTLLIILPAIIAFSLFGVFNKSKNELIEVFNTMKPTDANYELFKITISQNFTASIVSLIVGILLVFTLVLVDILIILNVKKKISQAKVD